jgi:hypothetical protein
MKGGIDHFNTIIVIIYYIIKTTNIVRLRFAEINVWLRLIIEVHGFLGHVDVYSRIEIGFSFLYLEIERRKDPGEEPI